MKKRYVFILLTFYFVAWFSWLLPWDKIVDPDAFYHIKMAQIIHTQGVVRDFSWLDLTILKDYFVDQHYLFHLIESGFLYLFSPLLAMRIVAIFLAVILFLFIAYLFSVFDKRYYWLWVVMLSWHQPLATRVIQGKASPLVILLYLIGIYLVILFFKSDRKIKTYFLYFLMFLVSFLFALSHGGWIILLISILILLFGNVFFEININKFSFLRAVKSTPWLFFIFSLFGIGIGLFIHPNRDNVFRFLWVQIVDVFFKSAPNIALGTEWRGIDLMSFLFLSGLFGLMSLIFILGLFLRVRKDFTKMEMRILGILIFLLAGLSALTVKSVRFAEYLQPVGALFIVILISRTNWKKIFIEFKHSSSRFLYTLLQVTLALSFSLVVFTLILNSYNGLHDSDRFRDGQFNEIVVALRQNSKLGDRVYNVSWDEFPILFYKNDYNRYISGMDPTFLYKTRPKLAIDSVKLMNENEFFTKNEVWDLIVKEAQADYVFLNIKRFPYLIKYFDRDERFVKLKETDDAILYKIR